MVSGYVGLEVQVGTRCMACEEISPGEGSVLWHNCAAGFMTTCGYQNSLKSLLKMGDFYYM